MRRCSELDGKSFVLGASDATVSDNFRCENSQAVNSRSLVFSGDKAPGLEAADRTARMLVKLNPPNQINPTNFSPPHENDLLTKPCLERRFPALTTRCNAKAQ